MNSPAGINTIDTPCESSIASGSTVGWGVAVGSGVFVGGISVAVGSGVAVVGISVGVGDTSVGVSSGDEDASVGMDVGVVLAPHPLAITLLSVNISIKIYFRRFNCILFGIFSFYRIVLDLSCSAISDLVTGEPGIRCLIPGLPNHWSPNILFT